MRVSFGEPVREVLEYQVQEICDQVRMDIIQATSVTDFSQTMLAVLVLGLGGVSGCLASVPEGCDIHEISVEVSRFRVEESKVKEPCLCVAIEVDAKENLDETMERLYAVLGLLMERLDPVWEDKIPSILLRIDQQLAFIKEFCK